MTRRANLHAVPDAPEPAPDVYTEHRRHILSRDWAAVHVAADRRRPFGSVFGRRG